MPIGSTNAIALQDVAVRIRSRSILDVQSLSIPFGSVLLVKGLSGSGKSTLLEVIAGLRRAEGMLRLHRSLTSDRIGCVFDNAGFDGGRTVESNVQYEWFLSRNTVFPRSRWIQLLQEFGVEELRHKRTTTLSRGELQRIRLTTLFAACPALAIMDEPDTGLDLVQCGTLGRQLTNLAASGGVAVMSTHSSAFDHVGTGTVFLENGRVSETEAGRPASVSKGKAW